MASILICDDAMFMRQSIVQLLKDSDHVVIGEAENGLQAVEKYQIFNPDIVLMDITMPELNGIEATKRILEIDANAKIIIVSAMGQQEMVFESITAGAKDFIVKPFQKEKLFSCIAKYA